ncbi:hypothetical protein Tco_0791774 [Tanacetum coccineum]
MEFSNAGYKSEPIATTVHADENVNDTGVEPKDIELVLTQAGVSRNDKGDGLFDLLWCAGESDILVAPKYSFIAEVTNPLRCPGCARKHWYQIDLKFHLSSQRKTRQVLREYIRKIPDDCYVFKSLLLGLVFHKLRVPVIILLSLVLCLVLLQLRGSAGLSLSDNISQSCQILQETFYHIAVPVPENVFAISNVITNSPNVGSSIMLVTFPQKSSSGELDLVFTERLLLRNKFPFLNPLSQFDNSFCAFEI